MVSPAVVILIAVAADDNDMSVPIVVIVPFTD
jgi:hypothetical protein